MTQEEALTLKPGDKVYVPAFNQMHIVKRVDNNVWDGIVIHVDGGWLKLSQCMMPKKVNTKLIRRRGKL